jgi:hypothetical protein
MHAAFVDAHGPAPSHTCPVPDCTAAECSGACIEGESCCPNCGATDPFRSDPDCDVCYQARGEIVRHQEIAAGWDATP